MTLKNYLFLFFILSFFIITSSANAFNNTRKKLNDNMFDLITFITSPDDSKIYSIHSKAKQDDADGTLMISDMATGAILKKIPVPLISDFYTSWHKPKLAISPDGKRLYVVDTNKITYLVDLKTNEVSPVKNKPQQDIGQEVASSIIAMPDGKHLYIADGVSQLHSPAVIHTIDIFKNSVVATVPAKSTGWIDGLMALNSDASLLYISKSRGIYEGEISILDTRTNRLDDDAIKTEREIEAMAINPANGKLYVTQNNHIKVIDPLTRKVIDDIKIGDDLVAMTFALDGSKLFLLDRNGGNGIIQILDTATKKVRSISHLVSSDSEIRTSADGERVYVSEVIRNTFTIIDAYDENIICEFKLINSF